MEQNIKSIRAFVGSKNFDLSRQFYLEFGFEEFQIDQSMSFFRMQGFGFYLQSAYVKDWVDNTMLFLEVDNPEAFLKQLKDKKLVDKYPLVRLTEIHYNDWGCEFFMHDPSGVLWHIGKFNS